MAMPSFNIFTKAGARPYFTALTGFDAATLLNTYPAILPPDSIGFLSINVVVSQLSFIFGRWNRGV